MAKSTENNVSLEENFTKLEETIALLEQEDISLEAAFQACGYHLEVLGNDTVHAVDVGLKYVNNDACYPSLLVVGQIMEALLSGKYDLSKTAVIITQTGGGCHCYQVVVKDRT